MTTLILASTLLAVGKSPVVLEATPSKAAFAPGEEITINMWLRNTTDKAVVVATAKAPFFPYANVHSTVSDSQSRRLPVLSNFTLGQWGMSHVINPEDFTTLKPGQKVRVSSEKFSEFWTGKVPGLKSELATTPKQHFEAGSYSATYYYKWGRELNEKNRQKGDVVGYNPPFEFKPGARVLYDKAFAGDLKTTVTFTVR